MVVGTSVNFLELENSLEGTNHSQTPPLLTSKEERYLLPTLIMEMCLARDQHHIIVLTSLFSHFSPGSHSCS